MSTHPNVRQVTYTVVVGITAGNDADQERRAELVSEDIAEALNLLADGQWYIDSISDVTWKHGEPS